MTTISSSHVRVRLCPKGEPTRDTSIEMLGSPLVGDELELEDGSLWFVKYVYWFASTIRTPAPRVMYERLVVCWSMNRHE